MEYVGFVQIPVSISVADSHLKDAGETPAAIVRSLDVVIVRTHETIVTFVWVIYANALLAGRDTRRVYTPSVHVHLGHFLRSSTSACDVGCCFSRLILHQLHVPA